MPNPLSQIEMSPKTPPRIVARDPQKTRHRTEWMNHRPCKARTSSGPPVPELAGLSTSSVHPVASTRLHQKRPLITCVLWGRCATVVQAHSPPDLYRSWQTSRGLRNVLVQLLQTLEECARHPSHHGADPSIPFHTTRLLHRLEHTDQVNRGVLAPSLCVLPKCPLVTPCLRPI